VTVSIWKAATVDKAKATQKQLLVKNRVRAKKR
jgi:hypothetical protein